MTKTSLIAIIWVWLCVVYGQLPVNNPYYIPFASTFVPQPHYQQNYDGMVLVGNEELLKRISPFQGAIFVKMKRLEAITASLAKQLKATRDDLAKKADQSELEKINSGLQTTSNNLEITTKSLATTRTELSDTKSDVEDLTIKLNAMTTSEIVDIGHMPTSCFDLQRMGHKLSGFFSVKGSKKMEMIYCNFNLNQNDKQKLIGNIDVKSTPVYFYVQRDSSFTTTDTPISFQVEVVNEGNAMDLKSGKFTAPRPGIYFFSFMGLARFPVSSSSKVYLGVILYLNEGRIGTGYVEETNAAAYQNSPLTLQSTLNLKKGDQVWVAIWAFSSGASLYDDYNHFTHFTGFLLEEEIVASL